MSSPRTLIRLTLIMDQAWAVGAVPDGRAEIDLPILVDPRNGVRAYLPATSLVGSLRGHLRDEAEHWLGPMPPHAEEPTGNQRPTPSRLWALGTRLDASHVVEIAASTRIDGPRAAAAAGSLRVEQSVGVKADASVDWYLQADEILPETLIEALASWQPFVGRRRSSGLGRCRVTAVHTVTLDLDEPDHLTWWLTGRHEWMRGSNNAPEVGVKRVPGASSRGSHALPPIDWRVEDPLAVGTGESPRRPGAASSERAFRRRAGLPIVPGTAWKGIFRHRVEFILSACGADPVTRAHVTNQLFGAAAGHDRSTGASTGGRGILRFSDSRVRGSKKGEPATVKRTHVAIDRLTGGARDGLLFTVNAIEQGAKIRTQIESDSPLEPAVKNLLYHVARDIDDGLIGVGGMTSRGYGTLSLTERTLLTQLDAVDVDAVVRALAEGSR